MDQQFFDNAHNRNIKIDAKPRPVMIDAARTAVIVVDMQNDFGTPGGMFDRAGFDISMIQKAVDPTAQVLASARAAGIKIVYLRWAFSRTCPIWAVLTLRVACLFLESDRQCALQTALKVASLSATPGTPI